MTTHYSKEFKVKTYTCQLSYVSSDNTKQVAIRARIIPKGKSKEKRYNIVCYDENSDPIKLTQNAFKTKKIDIKILNRIADINERVLFAIHHHLAYNINFTQKSLTDFVYTNMIRTSNFAHSDEFIEDPDFIKELSNLGIDFPVSKDVISKIASLKDEDTRDGDTGELVDYEELVLHYQIEHDKKLKDEEIAKMGVDDRYKKGYFNKNNIFEVFGFCWSINENTNKPHIANSYKSLIIRLADYRVNGQPIEDINSFNEDWVNEFILFLKNEGYADIHPKNYTPFNVQKHDFKLLSSNRKNYVYKSFDKQIKHLKSYIEALQKNNLISKTCIDTRFIQTTDYFGGNPISYTRSSHALTKTEIEHVLESSLKGQEEIARQMFLIQIFAGGLRNEEFYNQFFKLVKQGDEYYFMWYADKVDKAVENPIIEGYTDVLLKQINYELPEFLKVEEYRSLIKDVAKSLGLKRIIRYKVPNAKTGNTIVVDKELCEIINPYWCRKSFVRLAFSLGWSRDKIIQWTGHGDSKTLKYYFDQLSAEEKRHN